MMPRVLVLMTTASYRARAFVDAAAAIGYPLVVGSDQAAALSALHPESHLALDFGDVDAAASRIEAHAARYPVAGVVASEDEGAPLAAEAARRLGLPHSPPDAVRRARDKRLMREAFAAGGVPSPWFSVHAAAEDPARVAAGVRYPCVLKPPALSASRGVVRADTPPEFVEAFRRVGDIVRSASTGDSDPELLVEGYVAGAEVAVEGLLTGGRLRVLAVFDKPEPMEGPSFEETYYVTPSRLPPASLDAAARLTQEMTRALGLLHGPVHAELRINDEGAWPIEIAPRSIGGLCSRALRFRDGASLEQLVLRHAVGEDVSGWEREEAASGVLMIPIPRGGILHGVHGIEAARAVSGVEDVRITIPIGQRIVPLPEGNRYLGFVFARADGPEAAESALREAHARLSFEIYTE